MTTISNTTVLSIGTKVQVKNLVGEVVKVKMVQGIPSGMISVHSIKYTGQIVFKRNSDGSTYCEVVPLKKEIIKTCNYSFIHVL